MHYVRDDGNMMNCSRVIVLFAIPGILYLFDGTLHRKRKSYNHKQ